MLSAKVQPKRIKFEDRYLYMIYDIKTSKVYKKNTGNSLMSALTKMKESNIDDIEFAEIIAHCLRENPKGECLTLDYFEEYNPIAIVSMFAEDFKEQLMRGLDEKQIKERYNKNKSKDYIKKKSNNYVHKKII